MSLPMESRWILLDPNNADALTAAKIYYTTTQTIKEKLDELESLKANKTLDNVYDSTILNKLKNVDGAGSGLDADTLDGLDSSQFLRSDVDDTAAGNITIDGNLVVTNGHDINVNKISFNIPDTSTDDLYIRRRQDDTDKSTLEIKIGDNTVGDDKLEIGTAPSGVWAWLFRVINTGNVYVKGNVYANGTKLLAYNDLSNVSDATILAKIKNVDGPGSGLSADNLDGLDSSQFIRSDVNDSFSGTLQWARPSGDVFQFDSDLSYVKRITINDGQGNYNISANWSGSNTHIIGGGAARISLNMENQDGQILLRVSPNKAAASAVTETNLEIKPNSLKFNGQVVWHAGNDGSGSGLDADKLDGKDSSEYLQKSVYDTNNDGKVNKADQSDKLVMKVFAQDTTSPAPSTFNTGFWGIDAYNSTDFPSLYYSGWVSMYSNRGVQFAVGWDAETGKPRDVAVRIKDDTQSTWGVWDHLAFTDLRNVANSTILAKIKNVDGPGSGLDADTVDGKHASDFTSYVHTYTETITINSDSFVAYNYTNIINKSGKTFHDCIIQVRVYDNDSSSSTYGYWIEATEFATTVAISNDGLTLRVYNNFESSKQFKILIMY